jgi:hypothetical protein
MNGSKHSPTGDPILIIDAPVVHNAAQLLSPPYLRAGERCCQGLGSGAT